MSVPEPPNWRYALAAASLLLCSAVFVAPRDGPAEAAGRRVRAEADGGGVRQEVKAAPAAKGEVGPEPKGPGEAAAVALLDLERIAAADKLLPKDHVVKYGPSAPFMRYFWVSSAAKWRDDFLVLFCVHLNSLSSEGVVKWPAQVAPDVLRIDVRDYGWDKGKQLAAWEKTAAVDFVFHQKAKLEKDATVDQHWPGGASASGKEFERGIYEQNKKAGDVIDVPAVWLPQNAIDGLRKLSYSESPLLMAEWFYVQTVRQTSLTNDDNPGIGYLDFVGIKTRDDFFALTGVDTKVASKVFAEWRAAIPKSGISAQNRQGVVFGGANGRTFGTLDVFAQKGRGVVLRNLLPGELDHDAEEWIGRRGNGTWILALISAKDVAALKVKAGDAVASAPDKIGPDSSAANRSNDGRVHYISCVRCHFGDKDGLKPMKDFIRQTYRKGGPQEFREPDKATFLQLQSLYLRDLDEILDEERARFARDYKRMTTSAANPGGLTMPQIGKLYAVAWDRYAQDDLGVDDAARELGVEPKKLLDNLAKHAQIRGGGDLVLSAFLDAPPQKITRLDWESSYQLAMTLALGLNPAEQPKDAPVKPEFDKIDKKKGKGKDQ